LFYETPYIVKKKTQSAVKRLHQDMHRPVRQQYRAYSKLQFLRAISNCTSDLTKRYCLTQTIQLLTTN